VLNVEVAKRFYFVADDRGKQCTVLTTLV
jgi:hypothetical protein